MIKLRKKGQGLKYDIIIGLFIGLLVVGIILYALFYKYFTQEEIDWETCRESIVIRSGNLANGLKYVQENFPFRCKTEVINIDYYDNDKALKKIADTIASCYYTYGEGKYKLYGDNWFTKENMCFVCARVHFDSKVINEYSGLDVGNYIINTQFKNGKTYFDYLYGNMPSADSVDVLKDKVRQASVFNIKTNGDIFVLVTFSKGAEILGWIFPNQGYYLVTQFYQPNAKPKVLTEFCSTVETVPA